MKRLGTREAIQYAVSNLSAEVRTSGAVRVTQEYRPWDKGEVLCIVIYSYNMPIAVLVCGNDPFPSAVVVDEVKDWDLVLVARTKADENGWGGIEAATLQRTKNYEEHWPGSFAEQRKILNAD